MKLTTWVQTFLDGVNKPRDYPAESAREPFVVDAESAQQMIAGFRDHGSPLPVDFNHGMYQPIDGVPFPDRFERMGKIVDLQYRPGSGFYSLTEFTERGTEYIRRSEGAYFSGVVHIDPKTRKPKHMFGAALTPTPAINLEEIHAYSARTGSEAPEIIVSNSFKINNDQPSADHKTAGGSPAGELLMSDNLKKIAMLLNAEGEADPEKLAEKGVAMLEALTATRDVIALAAGLDPKVATLSEIGNAVKARLAGSAPDPEKFVAVSAFTDLKTIKEAADVKIAELSEKVSAFEADAAIQPYTIGREIKITPALKATALSIYKSEGKEGLDKFAAALPAQVVNGTIVTGSPKTSETSAGRKAALLAAELDPKITLLKPEKK